MIDTFLVVLNSLLVITVLLLLLKKQNAFESKEDLYVIFSLLNKISMDQTQAAQRLAEIKTQLEKAAAEIVSRIAALEEAVTNAGNLTPEVVSALQGVKDVAETLDAIVPDEQQEEEQ